MITKKVIDKIKESKRCKNALAYLLNVNPRTIDTWLKRNDIMLTTDLALNIISEELGVKKSEILEQEKVSA